MLIFQTDSAIDMQRKRHIISKIKGYGKNAAQIRGLSRKKDIWSMD